MQLNSAEHGGNPATQHPTKTNSHPNKGFLKSQAKSLNPLSVDNPRPLTDPATQLASSQYTEPLLPESKDPAVLSAV
jgi:hypothetical protein